MLDRIYKTGGKKQQKKELLRLIIKKNSIYTNNVRVDDA